MMMASLTDSEEIKKERKGLGFLCWKEEEEEKEKKKRLEQ